MSEEVKQLSLLEPTGKHNSDFAGEFPVTVITNEAWMDYQAEQERISWSSPHHVKPSANPEQMTATEAATHRLLMTAPVSWEDCYEWASADDERDFSNLSYQFSLWGGLSSWGSIEDLCLLYCEHQERLQPLDAYGRDLTDYPSGSYFHTLDNPLEARED